MIMHLVWDALIVIIIAFMIAPGITLKRSCSNLKYSRSKVSKTCIYFLFLLESYFNSSCWSVSSSFSWTEYIVSPLWKFKIKCKELKSRSDCYWTRTYNHLVHKRALNHLAKLAKYKSKISHYYLMKTWLKNLFCFKSH